MNIKLNALTLRTFRPDDLAFVFLGLSHPDVIKHYGISYSTQSDCEAQMSWYHSIAEDGTGCWLAIESAGMPLGALGLNNICHTNKKAEIGYWLLPQHWGKGVMRKALPGLLFYAFNDLKIHRISAEVEVENIKSQRLLQALGFTLEGISRECEIKEGRYISLMNYSLLSHEERLKPVVG